MKKTRKKNMKKTLIFPKLILYHLERIGNEIDQNKILILSCIKLTTHTIRTKKIRNHAFKRTEQTFKKTSNKIASKFFFQTESLSVFHK